MALVVQCHVLALLAFIWCQVIECPWLRCHNYASKEVDHQISKLYTAVMLCRSPSWQEKVIQIFTVKHHKKLNMCCNFAHTLNENIDLNGGFFGFQLVPYTQCTSIFSIGRLYSLLLNPILHLLTIWWFKGPGISPSCYCPSCVSIISCRISGMNKAFLQDTESIEKSVHRNT